MSRKPSGRLPADAAPDRPVRRPHSADLAAGVDVMQARPMTEQRLWDARRAATYVHEQAKRLGGAYAEIGPIGEVFHALGLAEPQIEQRQVVGAHDVSCPQCGEPIGERCRTAAGNEAQQSHHARRRKVALVRSGKVAA